MMTGVSFRIVSVSLFPTNQYLLFTGSGRDHWMCIQ